MKTKGVRMKHIFFGLCFFALNLSLVSQEEFDETAFESGDAKLGNGWGMNVQVSTVGFVIGGVYNYKVAQHTWLTSSLDLFWVNGENEQQVYDYNTQQYISINSETILMLPLVFQMKRRLFPETMSSNLRPFIVGGGGVVYGWFIDSDIRKSQLPKPQENTQYTYTLIGGIGADIGKPGSTGYGLDVKYQWLRYSNYLGARKKFDNIQVGFHVNFRSN